jgi:tRNA-splicing ligase RtcB
MGAGGKSLRLGNVSEEEFQNLVRGGAEYYVDKYGATFDRSRAERHRIPVEDSWQIPWGGEGRPERGLGQLGSLGGGNHFIELQREEESSTLFVQVHTGSRGFGHGLATNYFAMAKDERHGEIEDIDLGYFTRESRHRGDYLNAVAAGGNFAILNRLMIYEQVAEAFRKVFRADLELVYEISHNLVQAEEHPEFGAVWVHRKGATRAFPAGHPALAGTIWQDEGHPVLIPGSNRDHSYILRPLAGAARSGYSVNHGAGRRISRGEATRVLDQHKVNEQYRRDGVLVNVDGRGSARRVGGLLQALRGGGRRGGRRGPREGGAHPLAARLAQGDRSRTGAASASPSRRATRSSGRRRTDRRAPSCTARSWPRWGRSRPRAGGAPSTR